MDIEQLIELSQLLDAGFDPDTAPILIPMALSIAYFNRTNGNLVENLDKAIYYGELAVSAMDQSDLCTIDDMLKLRWMISSSVATAYMETPSGDKVNNYERAIHFLQALLHTNLRDNFPMGWALTEFQLARAYQNRGSGRWDDNLLTAMEHADLSLQAFSAEPANAIGYQADALLLMGDLFAELYKRLPMPGYFEGALERYQTGLTVYRQETDPIKWGTLHYRLGLLYESNSKDGEAYSLDQAFHHYHQALQGCTRETVPAIWAEVQLHLGNVQSKRLGKLGPDRPNQVDLYYHNALEMRDYLSIQDLQAAYANLAESYTVQNRWKEAQSALEHAIEIGKELLASAFTDSGRRVEAARASDYYPRLAYCLIRQGDYERGLIALEQGKARLLSEALALTGFLETLSQDARQALDLERAKVQAIEKQLRTFAETLEPIQYSRLSEDLKESRFRLRQIVHTLTSQDDKPQLDQLKLSELLQAIPQDTACIIPLVTRHGSFAFVLPSGTTAIDKSHLIALPDLDTNIIEGILFGTQDDPGWFSSYLSWCHDGTYEAHWQWKQCIQTRSRQLWNVLLSPIYVQLAKLCIKRVILIPHGGLQILPLHIAWRSENGTPRTLMDDYVVVFAPSLYILRRINTQPPSRSIKNALIVGVDSYKELPPLAYACSEAKRVSDLFSTSPLLNAAATVLNVADRAVDCDYLHFSCHGSYYWSIDPLESSLVLGNNERLSLFEVLNGRLDLKAARLVVLSACETGIIASGRGQAPDEHLGLPAGFLQAGASAVISSLWAVDDKSTSMLMEKFYSNHILEGSDPAQALREAQLWLRDRAADGLYKDPFYWASFIYTGV